jgi:adenosyl cobinamide kinase/adenosyl cobinamide phosphate guanylyltransferase
MPVRSGGAMAYTYVTGGASSGKSRFSLELLKPMKDVVFIATGVKTDDEMAGRIAEHRKERPAVWRTIEEPLDLISALERINEPCSGLIVDCLTMWISNLCYMERCESRRIIERAKTVSDLLERLDKRIVVVSNELGMGIIPATEESREYRSLAGEVNQIFAHASSEAYLVVSGIGIKLK